MGEYAKLPGEEIDSGSQSQSRKRSRKSRMPHDDFHELTPAASEVKVPVMGYERDPVVDLAREQEYPQDRSYEDRYEHARERAGEVADAVADRVEASMNRAAIALTPPTQADVGALVKETDLPALQGEDTVSELAARLDREADLWRNLAMREFARQSWMSKVTQAVAIGVLVVDAGLAIMAATTAAVGVQNAASRALLFGVAGLVLTLGAIVVGMVASASVRAQRDVARSALARADLAELRLHRVGVVLAWRQTTPELYQDALARLEREST